jgi:hypothetical protein
VNDCKGSLMVSPERRVKLGTVAVDTGRLLLADPCYVQTPGIDAVTDTLLGPKPGVQMLDGMGLLFAAGFGDGTYDVYATLGTYTAGDRVDERIKRVEIVLIQDDDDFGDVMTDALRAQADAAESDNGLIGSALARFCASRGWTRAQLAEWLYVNEISLAALYCEPRPVPTITGGNGFARGVFTEVGSLLALAAQYEVGNNESLLEAYRIGVDDVTAVRSELLTLAELRRWEALPIKWNEDVGGSEETWRFFMATADAGELRTALDAAWDRWVETGLTPAWQAASERWYARTEGGR